jgi:hypothetical protein
VDCRTHAPLAHSWVRLAGGAPISAAESVHLVLTCLGGAAYTLDEVRKWYANPVRVCNEQKASFAPPGPVMYPNLTKPK